MIELRRLRLFIVLAEELHFRRASQRLRIAQPALTRHIQQLERSLGQPLFKRGQRHVALTEAGGALLTGLRPVLASLDAVLDDVRSRRDGTFRLGYIRPALYTALPHAVARLRELHPLLDVKLYELHSPDFLAQLEHGVLDAAIVGASSVPAGITYVSFTISPYRICVSRSHALARSRDVSIHDLDGMTLVTPVSREPLHELFEQRFRSAGVRIARFDATSVESVMALVRGGVGFAIVPEMVRHGAGEGVAFVPLREGLPALDLGVATHGVTTTKFTKLLLKLLRELAARRGGATRKRRSSATPMD
jgi:DNA-binding transcriptional LysR family regulator